MKISKPKKSPRRRQTAREYLWLQRRMAEAIMRPLTPEGGMQPRDRVGRPMTKAVGEFIRPNDRLTSFERLEIYNRQYWFRLIDCFYDDFPGLRALLGEQRFDQLARAYLDRHPSVSFTLRNLGRNLVAFIASQPRWTAPRTALALDMARLEWAHIEAFDNESRPLVRTDDLAGIAPEKIRLRLQPHLTLLRLGCEADQFLIKIKQRQRLREDASNAIRLHSPRSRSGRKSVLRVKDIFVAVHRQNDTVYYKRLDPAQFEFLSALQRGAPLGQACESISRTDPAIDWAARLHQWFATWSSLGWFCR